MSTRRQQALEFFVKQGWTPHQAAGIVANLEAESGLRPVGDLETANQYLRTAQIKIKNSRSVYELSMLNLLKGRLYLLQNKPSKAFAFLLVCKRSFTQDGRSLEIMWSTIWLTVA